MTKNKTETDYRKNQKVIATIELDDRGQDFIELDVLENGVILGDSIMFSHGRLTLIGVGTLNGTKYYTLGELKRSKFVDNLKGMFVYFKNTDKTDPVPWEAQTLKYAVTGVKSPEKADRFLVKKSKN